MTRASLATDKTTDGADPARLDDDALFARVLARDDRAWREFVRRFTPPLREAVCAATDEEMREQDVNDVLGDFWLRLATMPADDLARIQHELMCRTPEEGVAFLRSSVLAMPLRLLS